jgi:hypothetical protein
MDKEEKSDYVTGGGVRRFPELPSFHTVTGSLGLLS